MAVTLRSVIGACEQPPITSGLNGVYGAYANISTVDSFPGNDTNHPFGTRVVDTGNSYDTWRTLVEETSAQGIINLMVVSQNANTSNKNIQARLSIDGNVVWTSDTNAWQVTGDDEEGFSLIGGIDSTGSCTYGQAPFSSSFKMEWKQTETVAASIGMSIRYRYHLTG